MNKPKFIFIVFLFLLATGMTNTFAQTETKQMQAEPSYEVMLQIIVASNNNSGDKQNVPASLANVVGKLKKSYLFSEYRLASTYLERISYSVEHKSVISEFGQNKDSGTPIFSEWSLNGLKEMPNQKGQEAIQFQSFRFGARVPVQMASVNSENGKSGSMAVSYESVGLTIQKFSLTPNVPTVIGSLSLSKPDELMFLILTVKPAEE